jgi:hypothetical protein
MISGRENDSKNPSLNFLEKFYETFDICVEDKSRIGKHEEFRKAPPSVQLETFQLKEKLIKC